MEKISDEFFMGSYIKTYKSDQNIDCIDFIKKLQNLNFNLNYVHIYEDSDLGMKQFEGEYTLAQFLELYKNIDNKRISGIVLFVEGNISIILHNSNFISVSSSQNLEIDDIMSSEYGKHK